MATEFRDTPVFMEGIKVGVQLQSPSGLVLNSVIGLAEVDGGFPTYSVSNFTASDNTCSATQSTAAQIAATQATLILELAAKGIINAIRV